MTTRGRVAVSIERLVLTGLPLDAAQAAELKHAVERELSRLLKLHPPPLERWMGAVAQVNAPSIEIRPGGRADATGRRIAWSIHHSLGGGQ